MLKQQADRAKSKQLMGMSNQPISNMRIIQVLHSHLLGIAELGPFLVVACHGLVFAFGFEPLSNLCLLWTFSPQAASSARGPWRWRAPALPDVIGSGMHAGMQAGGQAGSRSIIYFLSTCHNMKGIEF
jgi:hypothetical protein